MPAVQLVTLLGRCPVLLVQLMTVLQCCSVPLHLIFM
jgi:hypothetical protein